MGINIVDIIKEINSLPPEEKEKLNEITDDFCGDRDYCISHGVDYCNLPSKDIQKLRAAIYLDLRRLKEQQNQCQAQEAAS